MYSEASIDVLKARIGFGDKGEISITVNDTIGTSGRIVAGFHQLATIENLFATVDLSQTDETKFNAFLAQLKVDAVKNAVVSVMDMNEAYLDDEDYSNTLISKAPLFDQVIGYQLAKAMIEVFISSKRINDSERMIGLNYNKLKIELEGVTDENGRVISRGILSKLYSSAKKATNIIFPIVLEIDNATNNW